MTELVPTIQYLLALNCGGVLAVGFLLMSLASIMYKGIAAAIAQRLDQ